MLRGEEFLPRY